MKKKILKSFLFLFLGFIIFAFWLSPRLGGIIPMGKESPDQNVEKLTFDTLLIGEHKLEYQDLSNENKLKILRNKYKLDTLITNCKTEFEKVIKVQSWVHSRWKHDGDNEPEIVDALFILKEAEKGKRFRCVEYGFVAKECLSSLGIKIRGLSLMTKDVSEVKSGAGHVANEVYLKDLKKWVFLDPQWDIITTLENKPLSAIELQYCIANNKNFEIVNPSNTTTKEEYKKWIGPYLYYFTVNLSGQVVDQWDMILGNKKRLTLMPKGAIKPAYFQKIIRLRSSYYTNSIKEFYPTIKE